MTRLALLVSIEGAERRVEVGPAGVTIGRDPQAGLHLSDDRVSGLHAELVWEEGRLVLLQRSRTNTTRLNGVAITDRTEVRIDDVILLAEFLELRVVSVDIRGESPAPSPMPAVEEPVRMSSSGDPPTRAVPVPQPPAQPAYEGRVKIAIVGSGPAGLAAGVQAATSQVPHVVLERSVLANTVERYQKGKTVMAEPSRLPLHPGLALEFEQGSKERVLAVWREGSKSADVNLLDGPEFEVVSIEGQIGGFRLELKGGQVIDATHVVIAIGVQGDPRKFGVEGEGLPHVSYELKDPADHDEERIVVVGAGDSAIENALGLAQYDNQVFLVNRREGFDRAKSGNRAAVSRAIDAGTITLYENSTVDRFEERSVILQTPEGEERIEVDWVLGRLGAIPPRGFLEDLGVVFPSKSREAFPQVGDTYESNVPGIYLVGAVVGYPLIKNCMNQGYEVVEHILGRPVKPADEAELARKLAPLGLEVSEAINRIRETVPLFRGLTTIQLRDFLFDAGIRTFAPGEFVYERNDFSNTLFAVLEGEVEASYPKGADKIRIDLDEERKTQLLTNTLTVNYSVGEFFGEMGLISGRRRAETVRASTGCILVESSRNAMNRLLNSSPEVRQVIDETFAEKALARLLPGVRVEQRKEITAASEMRLFQPGDALFLEGQAADGVFLIRRGSVSLSQSRDGRDVVLQYVQAGNVIGERSLLSKPGVRTTTVVAKTIVEAIWIPAGPIRRLVAGGEGLEEVLRSLIEDRVALSEVAKRERHRGTVQFMIDESGAYEATDMLLIDESLCIRCDNCETACSETHGGVSRLDREAGPTYQSSNGSQLHIPTACQHCENPRCMDDCPPDALQRHPNGEVYVLDTCIGCGYCVSNCPYNVIKLAAVEQYRPPGILGRLLFGDRKKGKKGIASDSERETKPAAKASTPEAEPKKKALKCDLCMLLPEPRGDRPKAACVAACPTGAIVRADPRAVVDEILRRP